MQLEYNTSAKTAIKSLLVLDSLSEEMRVFYVALTRAKEKLFVVGTCKDYEKQILNIEEQAAIFSKENDKINYILLKKCKSYLDWLLLINNYNSDDFNKLAKINIVKIEELQNEEVDEDCEKIDIRNVLNNHDQNIEEINKIKNIIEFKYNNQMSTLTPTKTSVSELKSISKTLNNNENIYDQKQNISNESNISSFTKPRFLNKEEDINLSGAEKGTLMHMCLQRLDVKIDYTKELISEMIEEMYNKNIISLKEKESINQYKLYQFTKSNIWKELQCAKKVYKEKPFYIEVDANKVLEENKTDKVLVQGIIDLFYINKDEDLVLVDYKTDYVQNEQELIDKYSVQLDLYKQALEKSLNRKVSKIIIYSLYLEKEIELG